MFKSLAVLFKKFFIAWKVWHTIYEKETKELVKKTWIEANDEN